MKLNAQHCAKQRWVGVKTQSFEGSVFVIVDLWNHNLSFFLSLPFFLFTFVPFILFFLLLLLLFSSLLLSSFYLFHIIPNDRGLIISTLSIIAPFPLFNPSLFPPSRAVFACYNGSTTTVLAKPKTSYLSHQYLA
jgi:hypothetical protein